MKQGYATLATSGGYPFVATQKAIKRGFVLSYDLNGERLAVPFAIVNLFDVKGISEQSEEKTAVVNFAVGVILNPDVNDHITAGFKVPHISEKAVNTVNLKFRRFDTGWLLQDPVPAAYTNVKVFGPCNKGK